MRDVATGSGVRKTQAYEKHRRTKRRRTDACRRARPHPRGQQLNVCGPLRKAGRSYFSTHVMGVRGERA